MLKQKQCISGVLSHQAVLCWHPRPHGCPEPWEPSLPVLPLPLGHPGCGLQHVISCPSSKGVLCPPHASLCDVAHHPSHAVLVGRLWSGVLGGPELLSREGREPPRSYSRDLCLCAFDSRQHLLRTWCVLCPLQSASLLSSPL